MAEQTITEAILGKDIDTVTYADVEQYFTRDRIENIRLEFKSYVDPNREGPKAHLAGVYEGLSGMLNSEGGLIVWGAPVGVAPQGSKEKVFTGALTVVDFDAEDDQMNDGILQNISPMPPRVRFRKLTNGSGRIYLFEVPRSPYSPHQYKGTYYARFNASTRKAPHYLVEALMRKVSFPNIGVTVELRQVFRDMSGKTQIHLIATCKNHSRLQNERDLVLHATNTHAVFQTSLILPRLGAQLRHGNGTSTVILNAFDQQLHNGLSKSTPLVANIAPNTVIEDDLIYLQIAIAGRLSPMKYSSYEIKILPEERDMSKLIRVIKENVLSNEDEPLLGDE